MGSQKRKYSDKHKLESLYDAWKVELASAGTFERARELISYPPRPLFIYRVGACWLQYDTMPLGFQHIIYIVANSKNRNNDV